jgi:UDP-glucose 4-epimerase
VKVVVTGGAGFIGSNLGRELLKRPDVDEVVALDDLSTGFRANLEGTGIRLLEGTILDPDALDEACEGAAAVVHLAALPSVPRSVLDPVASHHANATGTLEVLQAARRAGDLHVVVASSSSVYGANLELPKRESMRTAPISPYAVSKQATEAYAMSFGHTYGLPDPGLSLLQRLRPAPGRGPRVCRGDPGVRRLRVAWRAPGDPR